MTRMVAHAHSTAKETAPAPYPSPVKEWFSVNLTFYLKPNCTKLAKYTHLQTNSILRGTQLEPS
ncbi:hypothetical protein T265_06359 [Opisthorchis viverrini]|uniref:Uncharacterized protein n=1 Tax=Opisthorchis viverrini TaxID=6198 RepID=A0A074ZSM9_OPIVI|nr:hypothetical protein T265_06359 [Opisthorchis viverrini]KER26375.1 hypothetical protein T265_06359 [Opisthorchis viverrini]